MTSRLHRVACNASRRLFRFPKIPIRCFHARKELPYPIEAGVGNFLPPEALRTLVDYQDGLLERLTDELRTDPNAEFHSSVAQTVIQYAEKKQRTLAFNYAVLALNNSFFLDQLSPLPEDGENHEKDISADLFKAIRHCYGDLTMLKSTFSAAALGMFTNGWVWMTTDSDGNLGILPTFGPSTLLVRSRMNLHYGEDSILGEPQLPSHRPSSSYVSSGGSSWSSFSGGSHNDLYRQGQPHSRSYSTDFQPNTIHGLNDSFNNEAKGSNIPELLRTGANIFPLFCITTYEHAWMSAGFGVWGKELWLKEFWTVLDWRKVGLAYAAAKHQNR